MTSTTRFVWIRQRSLLGITSPAWHIEQQVTPAGILVTSCAIVIAPDEVERMAAEPAALDPAEEWCAVCCEHLQTVE